MSREDKTKCWVVFDDDFPGGMVYQSREEALQHSEDYRSDYGPGTCYVRVKYFTEEELDNMIEP